MSVSDGAADREASGHGVQRLPAGLGAPQQAFSQSENCKCYTLALLAVSALLQNCVIVETVYS